MIDAVYILFFWLLILEVLLFLLLALPLPDVIRRNIVAAFTSTKFMAAVMKLHLATCFLAALFYVDLYQTENVYSEEKNRLKMDTHGHTGSGNTTITQNYALDSYPTISSKYKGINTSLLCSFIPLWP